MSKIGQKQIAIPASVTVNVDNEIVHVKGNNGELTIKVPKNLDIKLEGLNLSIIRLQEDKKTKSLHGLYRQILANAVQGVESMWQKKMEIVGTGFNVKLQGESLVFKLGYSHPVTFEKVEGVRYQVDGNNKVIIMGIDKQLVGQVAYQIKLLRKPDVYKGKGIRYEGEKLRIKPGKKAKAA